MFIGETLEHCITVATLRELLSELREDDILIPNDVGNLAIERNGLYIGYVDLGANEEVYV